MIIKVGFRRWEKRERGISPRRRWREQEQEQGGEGEKCRGQRQNSARVRKNQMYVAPWWADKNLIKMGMDMSGRGSVKSILPC